MFEPGKLGLVVVALLTLAAGCGRQASDLHGPWKMDVEKMVEDRKQSGYYRSSPPEIQKEDMEGKRKEYETSEVIISDGKMEFKTGEKRETIDWKIASQEGDKWSIELTKTVAQAGKSGAGKWMKGDIEWLDDDRIVVSSEYEGKLYLVRKK